MLCSSARLFGDEFDQLTSVMFYCRIVSIVITLLTFVNTNCFPDYQNIMKCPACKKAPLSFVLFVSRLKLGNVTCRNCGNKLQRERPSTLIWNLTLVVTIALGILIAVIAVYLQEVRDWNAVSSMLITIASITAIGILIELLLYFKTEYKTTDDE